MAGAKNCQTWASYVLELAKKEYLESEDCPKCFGSGSGAGGGTGLDSFNFGKGLR